MDGDTLEGRIALCENLMNVALETGDHEAAVYMLQEKRDAEAQLLRLSFLADPNIVREYADGPG